MNCPRVRAVILAAATLSLVIGPPRLLAREGGPKYGSFGYDAAGGDRAVRPGNDFYRYANGTWVRSTVIPADKAAYSLRAAMSDLTEQRLHDLMEQAPSEHTPQTLEGRVGAFYRSFLNEDQVEQRGAAAIQPELDAIRAATTRDRIAALMGLHNSDFEGTLFGLGIDVDIKDPNHYALYTGQAGLGLPDRDYYLQESFAEKKQKYQQYAGKLLAAAGWPEPGPRAAEIVALETRVAEASWTRTQQRDPVATYNPMTVAELQRLTPGFAWAPFLASAGFAKPARIVVGEKSAFPKLAAIFAQTPVPTLQAWLAFMVADNSAPYLSHAFVDAAFEMRNQTLSGQKVLAVRWKRAVHAVSGGDFGAGDRFDRFGNLGWGVGQLYTARWFPPESKAQIESLVVNLKAAYRARIQRLDWMSPATRAMALRKLDTYQIKVGYPDHPRDYSAVEIRDDDLIGNVRRAAAADWKYNRDRFAGPVDRGEWGMTPQTNDAYNGSLRDIVFPAGILQPPIFDAAADPAINYGAAGGVIGHELTHGFDDQGRKFDDLGRLRDWWAPSDAKTFDVRAAKLAAQYSTYEPLPGAKVNGRLTLGENIADLGGVTLALEAYRASLHGRPAPVIDGFTGDQRVFLGWAQAWRGLTRDDAVRRQVVSDPHSPRMYRVNGAVRNVDEWYAAFGVEKSDSLYLAPADRVHIW